MANSRFPLRCLPHDLCSEVLKTMDPHELIAFSFLSKKSSSLVKSVRFPLKNARIKIGWLSMYLDFGHISVLFKWKMGENDEDMRSLDDVPVNVDVLTKKHSQMFNAIPMEFWPIIESKVFTWLNQGKSLGQWVHHLCSIFRCDCYEAEFVIEKTRFDIQSLRNTFPKLRRIVIHCFRTEPSDHDIQSVQNVLRAFLPYVENLRLHRVSLQDNFSIQHIGMENLNELELYYSLRNPKLDDLLALNVQRCTILQNQFSLRDLNRFFKLWKKGASPKLKHLLVHGNIETIPASDALLKGLQAEGSELKKEYIIQNCYGICAQIKMLNTRFIVSVEFTVLN